MTVTEQDRQLEHPQWFLGLDGLRLGFSFVGDKSRMHIGQVVVLAPDSLKISTLCEAGDADGRDVSTVVRNTVIDVESEDAVRRWWASKTVMSAGAKLNRMLPGGLRKPRVCRRCQDLYDE